MKKLKVVEWEIYHHIDKDGWKTDSYGECENTFYFKSIKAFKKWVKELCLYKGFELSDLQECNGNDLQVNYDEKQNDGKVIGINKNFILSWVETKNVNTRKIKL